MPRIFTGRVVIPGEQLPQYFEAMAEAEAARATRAQHRQEREQLEATATSDVAMGIEPDAAGLAEVPEQPDTTQIEAPPEPAPARPGRSRRRSARA